MASGEIVETGRTRMLLQIKFFEKRFYYVLQQNWFIFLVELTPKMERFFSFNLVAVGLFIGGDIGDFCGFSL